MSQISNWLKSHKKVQALFVRTYVHLSLVFIMETDRVLCAVPAEAIQTAGDITETEIDCIFRDVTS